MDYAKQLEVFNQFRGMSSMDLLAVNKVLVAAIRDRQRLETMKAATAFHPGQLVQFSSSKTGRRVYLRVTKFNQKTVGGQEVNEMGVQQAGMREWRVSPGMLTAHSVPKLNADGSRA